MKSVQIFSLTFLHGQLSDNENAIRQTFPWSGLLEIAPANDSLVIYFAFYELDMYLRLPLNTDDNGFCLRDS